jgi:hypothetical protein
MKLMIVILAAAVVASVPFLAACKPAGSSSVQAAVDAAVARGDYQLIGVLVESEGKITYPQVPGVPEWYFSVTGMRVRTVKPEARDAELTYMKSYNDALYTTLKAQGRFPITKEQIAKVKAVLVKRQTQPNTGANGTR